jgi:hypothetical protein
MMIKLSILSPDDGIIVFFVIPNLVNPRVFLNILCNSDKTIVIYADRYIYRIYILRMV